MTSYRLLVPALAALLTTLAAPAHAANPAATGTTTVISNCVDHKVEPKRVIIACGDGGLFLGIKRYKYWSATSAVGFGAIRQNDCEPDCAEGTYSYTKARIRLYHARPSRHGTGELVFTRAIATYTGAGGATRHKIFYLLRDPVTTS
ncbi:hypothetical protein D9V37_13250 [Nocardioides mangrovicus]|uniref:Secreted protein n=1 Tax=Nocardioides mangrovicus TaxID=2478913 RepID=A0A3L8P1A3_9ACTN|nr:hypothetical protein [Nocardioides mangrovicus]RLV48692.1 hypothetical protein D9V37_13250 [Nocardioides mangrovicus]